MKTKSHKIFLQVILSVPFLSKIVQRKEGEGGGGGYSNLAALQIERLLR